MRLVAYTLSDDVPPLVPASANRDWMDATASRFAYRCIPLGLANASGWELINTVPFAAEWDGTDGQGAIRIIPLGPKVPRLVTSHFGHGVLTFHTEYMFRTEPGWAVWVRGTPNRFKDGIAALDGLVETDWLPFPFTMNWRFTRPGRIEFAAGEPFAFITLTPHVLLDRITPELTTLAGAPQLRAEYEAWGQARADFNERLENGDPATVKQGWQRYYVKGQTATGGSAPGTHMSKRSLSAPVVSALPEPLVDSLGLLERP